MFTLVILFTLVAHYLYDFNQGPIANFKCKDWWKENYPDYKYKNDYKVACFIHALTWSIVIIIPSTIYLYIVGFLTTDRDNCFSIFSLILINTVVHNAIDDSKANQKSISLFMDQAIHFFQIIYTLVTVYAISL